MDSRKLVDYAIRAPSGHNTQPWTFRVQENEIQIHPDFSRRLPVVDSDDHALYISLGCAAENIMIAATHYGFQPSFSLFTSNKDSRAIRIGLSRNEKAAEDGLFHFINERQSTRNEYDDKEVPADALNSLANSSDFEGTDLICITGREKINVLKPFIIEGSNRQFENNAFVDELVSWIRFSEKNAQETGDGLRASSLGVPSLGRWIGSFVMKNIVSAKSEAKRWKSLIDASAGFFLFAVEENDIPHWIRLGRSFQRFALTAAKLDISHAHVNMPCEEL